MKRFFSPDPWLWALLLITLVATPVRLSAVLRLVSSHYSDYLSAWKGMRALLHHADPYTVAETHEIQMRFFGRIVTDPRTDPQAFVYPAHMAVLLSPLALLPWKASRNLLTAMLPPLVGIIAWIWLGLCGITRHRVAVILLIVCSWPAIWAYQQTQLTVVALAAVSGACFFFAQGDDGVAGVLLAASTIKPNIAGLVVLWFLFQASIQHRWRFLLGFLGSVCVLLAASEGMLSGWVPKWLGAARSYGSNPWKPPLLTLSFGHIAGPVLIVLLAAWIVVRLWRNGVVLPASRNFAGEIALLLAVTVCVVPTTIWMVYNDLLLIPGILIVLQHKCEQNPVPHLIRSAAHVAIGAALLSIPCAALFACFMPHSLVGIIAPFCIWEFLPLFIVASLLMNQVAVAATGRESGADRSATTLAIQ